MELIRDLRSSGLLIAVKAVIVAVFAVSMYTFGTFAQSTSGAVNGSLAADREVDLYGLIDTFLGDPEGFERFRASEGDLSSLADFLGELAGSERLDFLSAFDQPIVARDFAGGDGFDTNAGTDLEVRGEYRGSDGALLQDVKSMQMNHEMFGFSRLTIDVGSPPDWSAVDYTSGSIPVLLGADYRGVYEVGDAFQADVYGAPQRLRVEGILSPGSAVFYRGDLDHYLDDTVVLPYPSDIGQLVRQDRYLGGIVAFAMLNTDLAASSSMSYDDVVDELASIAARTGFHDYSLQGVPTYLVQLRLVRQIIVDNFVLLTTVLLTIGAATVTVCAWINRTLCSRRRRWGQICRTVGMSDRRITRTAGQTWAVEYAAVLVLYSIGCAVLPNHHASPFLGVLLVLAVWFGLDLLVRRQGLLRATTTLGGER